MSPIDSASKVTHPSTLYKYTCWDENSEKQSFRHKILTVPQIYFVAPSLFNDPFDCQLSRGLESKSNEEIIDYFKANYPSDKELIRTVVQRLRSDRGKYLDYINFADIKKTDLQSGLFCLSAEPVSSLLWSHYASGHKGFCVGFNTQSLIRHMETLSSERGVIFDHFQVEYREVLPTLEPFLDDSREWFLQRFRFKAFDWSYEQEYRLVLIKDIAFENNERAVEISSECISEVILGCKLDDTTEAEIIASIEKLRQENPRLKLLRAVKSKKRYQYELQAI